MAALLLQGIRSILEFRSYDVARRDSNVHSDSTFPTQKPLILPNEHLRQSQKKERPVREQKCPSCGNIMDFITIGKDALDDMIVKCPKCLRITVTEETGQASRASQTEKASNHS